MSRVQGKIEVRADFVNVAGQRFKYMEAKCVTSPASRRSPVAAVDESHAFYLTSSFRQKGSISL